MGFYIRLMLFIFLFVTGCGGTASTPKEQGPEALPWFEEIGLASGLDFEHDCGAINDKYFMPQITGSGAAIIDFDNDGLLDLYLLNNGGPDGRKNRLFRQVSQGAFRDVTEGSGLGYSAYCQGVAVGDMNNDGRMDILVTEYGGVRLFQNDGGSFTDITASSGLKNPLWATSAAFVDFDRDGWLDLVVVNYLVYDASRVCSLNNRRDYCAPSTFVGTSTKLFRNRGSGRFEDVTIASGLSERIGPGLGIHCADFNGDGWPDFFVTNDGKPNHLWINQKNGTFHEEAVIRGLAVNAMGKAEANMGIALGDVDGDGMEDVFVTHLNIETNTLWKQGPRGLFQDRTVNAMLNRPDKPSTGFGTVMADFDRDGAIDLAIVNGSVTRSEPVHNDPQPFLSQYYQQNQIFSNDGTGRFMDRSSSNGGGRGFSGYGNVGRGIVVGDFENDGRLQLLTTAVGGRIRLFKNVVSQPGNWLGIRAYDPVLNRDALGAEVTVTAGSRRWKRTVQTCAGYLTSQDPRVHFGLGSAGTVDSLNILWPDGTNESFAIAECNKHYKLVKGLGRKV